MIKIILKIKQLAIYPDFGTPSKVPLTEMITLINRGKPFTSK
jgi:hypothetical protein